MARSHINDPISHCPRGQGGRTFSLMKPGGKKQAPPGTPPNEAHRRGLRQKTQLSPMGRDKFPYGKYSDGTPEQKKVWSALSNAAAKRAFGLMK